MPSVDALSTITSSELVYCSFAEQVALMTFLNSEPTLVKELYVSIKIETLGGLVGISSGKYTKLVLLNLSRMHWMLDRSSKSART